MDKSSILEPVIIEDLAKHGLKIGGTEGYAILAASAAISLKRIADTLEEIHGLIPKDDN